MISQEIYICSENHAVLQQGVLIEEFKHNGSMSLLDPTNPTFLLYEKVNTSAS